MESKKHQRFRAGLCQDPVISENPNTHTVSSGLGTGLFRRIFVTTLLAVLTLTMTGCGFLLSTVLNAKSPEPQQTAAASTTTADVTSTDAPTAATTSAAASEPSSTAESMPAAALTPAPTPEAAADQQLLADAPEMTGLRKEFQDGEVIYRALDGNEYGIGVGEFAGEYSPNVFVNGAKSGCVSFVPPAAEKILDDQLAQISDDQLKLKILVPVAGNQDSNSRIDISFLEDSTDHTYMLINSADDMNVYNICPDSELFSRTPTAFDGTNLVIVSNLSRALRMYPDPTVMLNENAMYFVKTAVASNSNFCSDDFFNASFGDVFTQSSGKEVSLWLADINSTYSLTLDNIVKTDSGILIGITSAQD